MLSEVLKAVRSAGRLRPTVNLDDTAKFELLDYIASEMPVWRDDPSRSKVQRETALTGQLCAHLNESARSRPGFDTFQFRTEVEDEDNPNGKLDLVVSPCGVTILMGGRRYERYDVFLPIECKRLPTPTGTKRDPREYVYSQFSGTGGVYRFKFSLHGKGHSIGAMIGYIQEQAATAWFDEVNGWIAELSEQPENALQSPSWGTEDRLALTDSDAEAQVYRFASRHDRGSGTNGIDLKHLWIEMD